jgi:signal transduction histidine kinase
VTPVALVVLGERYWALGLVAAARGAFERAHAASDAKDATAAVRLAELALAVGDGRTARGYAQDVVKRFPGAEARTLLGRAQLAAGELAAARMSFAVAIDVPSVTPLVRATARLGLCRAATALGDKPGAAANAAAAFDDLVAGVIHRTHAADIDDDTRLVEDIVAQVAAHGRGADAAAALAAARAAHPDRPLGLVGALLIAARAAHGEVGVRDDDADAALAAEAAAHPDSTALALRALERRAMRPRLDTAARAEVVVRLEAMTAAWGPATTAATEPTTAQPEPPDRGRSGPPLGAPATAQPEPPDRGRSGPPLGAGASFEERARTWFLLATTYEGDPRTADRAEDAYRKGLTFQPGHAVAACRLALLMLERGDGAGALAEIERALRVDAGHGPTWRQAARVLESQLGAQGPALREVVVRLLDAANPGAGAAAGGAAPRLLTATAEVARGDVLAGVYAHGHRVKNLLGIIGTRARSARKLVEAEGKPELTERLRDLERDVTALYEEWAQYLRSMQTQRPTVEVVPVAPLVQEIVHAVQAKTPVPIAVDLEPSLPDLRGDRMLLREAVMNIVANAAEASAPSGGYVRVAVRQVATGGAPLVEIMIADTGPGIPRGHLARVFAPGYTTKDTGSGVGLTIAERIVTAHHGRVAIDSEEGRGTNVTLTLPTDVGGIAALSLGDRREEPA